MFESSVVPEAPKGRRSAVLSVSTFLQMTLLAGAIVIPMAHVSALPPVSLVPRPPIPKLRHVELVPIDESVRRAAMATGARLDVYRPRPFVAPTKIPTSTPRIFDDVAALPPGITGSGSSDGIPGLSPTIDLNQHTAAPAPPAPKPPVQAAQSTAPRRVRPGGDVRPPKLIREVRPAYPPLARQARIQGAVKLTAVVSREGTVQSLQVSSGHPLLIQAAMDAVRQWRYEPTLLNGEPVEVILVVDVNFLLSN